MIVVMDYGHGGKKNPGTTGNERGREIRESELVFTIGEMVTSLLHYHDGFTPVLTRREINEEVPLNNRTEYINTLSRNDYGDGELVVVSIHADGFKEEEAEGFSLFHYPDSEYGIPLAKNLHHHLRYRGIPDRGIKSRANLAILRDVKSPSVLVEVGFLTNDGDRRYLNTASGQMETAQCIYRGLQDYRKEVVK